MSKTNKAQIVIGLAALLLGTMVYVVDRPGDQSFVPSAISLFPFTPAVFGVVGHSLPTFVHVLAFCLFTTVLFAGGEKTAIAVCLSWFLVEVALELGQHPALAPSLSQLIPPWFAHLPILNKTDSYFLYGTFDPFDLLAIVSGALAAYVVIQGTARWRVSHE